MNEVTSAFDFLKVLGQLSTYSLWLVVVWAVWTKRLRLGREYDRERERADEERDDRKKAEALIDDTMPRIEKAIEALNQARHVTHTAVETAAEAVKRGK